MKPLLLKIMKPYEFKKGIINAGVAIPRIIGGLSLSLEFGSPKFGMPWSMKEDMGFFQVASWFPEDVKEFGIPFVWAPWVFAWLGAASEAIGGLFLALGLGTRISAFFIGMTMLTATFFQKWPEAMEYNSSWPLLPAMGFFWIALYSLMFGSGTWGLDHFLTRKFRKGTA
ncbi:MAG: DoxX family protein [Bacteroidota bacterium]|nr:DoxX family protein [Bacteroidota bacterium]